MDYITGLLSGFEGSGDILANADLAAGLAGKAKEFIGSTFQSRLAEAGSQISSNPILADSFGTINNLSYAKYAITAILVLWGAGLIFSQYFITSADQKEKLNSVNTILLGNTGILPSILMVWIIIMFITVIIPAVVSSTPKVNSFLNNINSVLSVFLGGK